MARAARRAARRSAEEADGGGISAAAAAEEVVAVGAAEKSRFPAVSLPRRLLRTSMAPILSLKRARLTRASTEQLLVFFLRVAALEAIRRVSRGRCPQVWWGLQGISLLQAPPFSWVQRWAPLRRLVEGTQSFSKPLIFLSLATAISSAVEEVKHASDGNLLDRVLDPLQDSEETRNREPGPDRLHTRKVDNVRRALAQAEVDVPERFRDEDLEKFLEAADENVERCVTKIHKAIKWRQTYHFLSSEELKQWSHLVSWHDCDTESRPILLIRLGPAYASLSPNDRPRFRQAVVSQIEYGVLHLLNDDDRRITVIMDCKGTTAIGFPVNMMRTCAALVQENYPTRLASLFAINLPPVVRVVANAVMQAIGQTTRKKVHLLGDVYMTVLSNVSGGTDKVPGSIGGACHCPDCMEFRTSEQIHRVSYDNSSGQLRYNGSRNEFGVEENDDMEESAYEEDVVTDFQSYNTILRVAIIGVLMLWVLIAFAAGLHESDSLPT